MFVGQCAEFGCVSSDKDGIRHQAITVRERNPALLPNGDDGSNQMLIHSHPAGDAIHDNADRSKSHVRSKGVSMTDSTRFGRQFER
jgi:hypothetical protein